MGVPPENIIMFAMNSTQQSINPLPGEVYNYDGGPNLWPTVKDRIDYVGMDNTPENLLKVLRGEDMTGIGSGRTLKSTSDDNIFIATSQHGGKGALGYMFPDGSSSALKSTDIISTIRFMQNEKDKKFQKLFWIMSACYSGSIFNKEFIESTDGVYAITAATPVDVGHICDYSEKVGTYINSCLHKRVSEFIRCNAAEKMKSVTLSDEYRYVYSQKTAYPKFIEEICEYGNFDLGKKTKASEFQGSGWSSGEFQKNSGRSDLGVRTVPIPMNSSPEDAKKRMRMKRNFVNTKIGLPLGAFDAQHGICNAYPKIDYDCYFRVWEMARNMTHDIQVTICVNNMNNWQWNGCAVDLGITEEKMMDLAKTMYEYCLNHPHVI